VITPVLSLIPSLFKIVRNIDRKYVKRFEYTKLSQIPDLDKISYEKHNPFHLIKDSLPPKTIMVTARKL